MPYCYFEIASSQVYLFNPEPGDFNSRITGWHTLRQTSICCYTVAQYAQIHKHKHWCLKAEYSHFTNACFMFLLECTHKRVQVASESQTISKLMMMYDQLHSTSAEKPHPCGFILFSCSPPICSRGHVTRKVKAHAAFCPSDLCLLHWCRQCLLYDLSAAVQDLQLDWYYQNCWCLVMPAVASPVAAAAAAAWLLEGAQSADEKSADCKSR